MVHHIRVVSAKMGTWREQPSRQSLDQILSSEGPGAARGLFMWAASSRVSCHKETGEERLSRSCTNPYWLQLVSILVSCSVQIWQEDELGPFRVVRLRSCVFSVAASSHTGTM